MEKQKNCHCYIFAIAMHTYFVDWHQFYFGEAVIIRIELESKNLEEVNAHFYIVCLGQGKKNVAWRYGDW